MLNGTEVVVKFDTLDEAAAAYRAVSAEYSAASAHARDLFEQLQAANTKSEEVRTRAGRVRNALLDFVEAADSSDAPRHIMWVKCCGAPGCTGSCPSCQDA